MFDLYNRNINYLRISVTDRCNLRCLYCIPEEGVTLLNHSDILSFEKITEFVNEAVKFGINKVRITGGEPLVRKGIVDLVKMLSSIKEINDLSMTTNAQLLQEFAKPLFDGGLHRLNISLDAINPEKYSIITRGGDINKSLNGISEARKVGFNRIKINCVIKNSSLEPDAQDVKQYCQNQGFEIRYIKQMNLQEGTFSVVEGGDGGHCATCNRLRLTANGKLKPCLFNNIEFDINKIGIQEAIKQAIAKKPKCGSVNQVNEFNNIGG